MTRQQQAQVKRIRELLPHRQRNRQAEIHCLGVPSQSMATLTTSLDSAAKQRLLTWPRRRRSIIPLFPFLRPKFALTRWVSRNMPAPFRAQLGKLLAHGKKRTAFLPTELPYPTSWRRPPLLAAGCNPERLKKLASELGFPFNQSLWPVFWLFPKKPTKVGLLACLTGSTGVQLASLKDLARRWVAPLGLVLPAEPDDTGFAATVSRHTGYPLGPSLTTLSLGFCKKRPCQAPALDAEFAQLFPKVSILMVTHNEPKFTELCLQSLELYTNYPNWELVAVDNGSKPETVRLLQRWAERLPNMRLLLNPENRGFPAACNQGAKLAFGEIFCLLNNDTVVTPGWLSALVDELLRDPKVGLVGPVSNGVSNEAQVRVPEEALQALSYWGIRRCQKFFRQSRSLHMLAFYCVATWRKVWEQLGGLDEAFGIGLFEDDDFSLRIRRAGYRLRCRLDAYVHHLQSSSFAKLSDTRYVQIYENNRKLFLSKRRGMRNSL